MNSKGCILLDLSAAFDNVVHSVLLRRLDETVGDYWFDPAWLVCILYLGGRSQAVHVMGKQYTSKPLTCGVPQGCVLGPLLFSVYMCGMGTVIAHCSITPMVQYQWISSSRMMIRLNLSSYCHTIRNSSNIQHQVLASWGMCSEYWCDLLQHVSWSTNQGSMHNIIL